MTDKALAPFFAPETRAKLNAHRPSFCAHCPIAHCTLGYVPPHTGTRAELLVGEAAGEEETYARKPFVGGAGRWLNSLLHNAGFSREIFSIVNVIGCRPPKNIFPGDPDWTFTSKEDAQAALTYCRNHHLIPFLRSQKWRRIIALGNKALRTLTDREGISVWRGSPLPLHCGTFRSKKPLVIPTIHPAAHARDPKYFSVCATIDFRRYPNVPPEHYNLAPTLGKVKAFNAKRFAFDFEWNPTTGDITLCGLSAKPYTAIVVPFVEPYITELKRIFENAEVLIGHNIIGADTKYFEQLGWHTHAKLVDTMFIQHLIQPDLPHSLAFVASVFSNKVAWKGHSTTYKDEKGNIQFSTQHKTWNQTTAIPREYGGYGGCASAQEAFALYNARDTDASLQIAAPLQHLLDRYNLRSVYENVSVPAAFITRDMNDHGLKVDKTALTKIRQDLETKLNNLLAQLPPELRPRKELHKKFTRIPESEAPWKVKTKICKGLKRDNTTHDPTPIVFDNPTAKQCPVCGRTIEPGPMKKATLVTEDVEKIVRPYNSPTHLSAYLQERGVKLKKTSSGQIATDKGARASWITNAPELRVLDEIKKTTTLLDTFAKSTLTDIDRVYFSLKVHGTSEGRLACSGQRKGIDPNIQNQPKEIRKLFIPDDPSFCFIDADIIQGENMLTAYLAHDTERLARLRRPDYNEHEDMATRAFGVPVHKNGENSHLYRPGKVVNHGRNYGLGWKKTLRYLHDEGYFSITAQDVKRMISIWSHELNPKTAQWQQRTIALAERQGFLTNPFGRKRWFTMARAATKALAFLPASTLADIVLRIMIALYPQRFPEQLDHLQLAATCQLPPDWRLSIQVHDSLVFQGPDESKDELIACITPVITQPWKELEGFRLGVDIAYSGKGQSWGSCKTISTLRV